MVKRLIIGLCVNIGALFAVTQIVPGVSYSGGVAFFILGGVLIGLVNDVVKPVIKLLSLPAIIFTGGLFLIVINALTLYFFDYLLGVLDLSGIDFIVTEKLDYLLSAIVFGIINAVERFVLKF